jgi:hypothetical protein
MVPNKKKICVRENLLLLLVVLNTFLLENAFVQNEKLYLGLLVTLPVLFVVIWQERNKGNTA